MNSHRAGLTRGICCALLGLATVGAVSMTLHALQSVANDPMQPFTIAVTLDHPIADVWQAITRKKLVDGYYLAPLWADITSIGAEINYGPP